MVKNNTEKKFQLTINVLCSMLIVSFIIGTMMFAYQYYLLDKIEASFKEIDKNMQQMERSLEHDH